MESNTKELCFFEKMDLNISAKNILKCYIPGLN